MSLIILRKMDLSFDQPIDEGNNKATLARAVARDRNETMLGEFHGMVRRES